MVKLSDTFVLSVFYHRSGIIFVALVANPRVATSMRSHIPLQMTWYHTMSSRYFLYCSLRGAYKKQYLRWDGIYYHRSGKNCGKFITTLPPRTHLTLEYQRVSFIFFPAKHHLLTLTTTQNNTTQQSTTQQ